METDGRLNPETAARTVGILYLALLLSTVIYGVMCYLATRQGSGSAIEPAFFYALVGVAAATMGIIPVLRGKMMPPTRDATSLGQPAPPAGDAARAALQRYFTAQIVSWALCESIAIYGLVLTFVSHDLRYFGGFFVAALINFVLYRPGAEDIPAVIRGATP